LVGCKNDVFDESSCNRPASHVLGAVFVPILSGCERTRSWWWISAHEVSYRSKSNGNILTSKENNNNGVTSVQSV